MIAILPPDGAAVVTDELVSFPESIAKPGLDLQLQRDAADLLTSPRCPVCHWPLVARMTCCGPKFLCLCDEE